MYHRVPTGPHHQPQLTTVLNWLDNDSHETTCSRSVRRGARIGNRCMFSRLRRFFLNRWRRRWAHRCHLFLPLAWMVEQVGGDDVTVISMTPSNVEPHDYELSPADIAKMNEADVVVYVEGFQPSMDDAVDSLTGPEVLELSGAVGLLPLDEEVADAHGDDDEGSNHGDLDPHFWLDPIRMRETSEYIEEALSQPMRTTRPRLSRIRTPSTRN